MSAHYYHQLRTLMRPHTTVQSSTLSVVFLILCATLGIGLVLYLIYSLLHGFQWFRNMVDPEARMRYNAERIERDGMMAAREIGGFARGFGKALSDERSLLCDRSGYLGGGRGYGWRTRPYGDSNVDDDPDSAYGSVRDMACERRGSDSSSRVRHRDDCDGECGVRRVSRQG